MPITLPSQPSRSDLKPANIFISESLDLVVGDFGVVMYDGGSNTPSSGASGTPLWMAPEELDGGFFDSRCDVWALGCVLVETLSCRHFSDREMHEKITAFRNNEAVIQQVLALIAQVS